MGSLLYIRLIGLTAGTLVQLFWMVVILGYRRQRNFERVFFFLCLALFFFYSGSLLALNAQIHYDQPPVGLREFVIAIIAVGLLLVPPLLMHLNVEFAETRGMVRQKRWKWAVLFVFYAASFHLAIQFLPHVTEGGFNFVLPGDSLNEGFAHIFCYSLLWSAVWQFRFSRNAPNPPERGYHAALSAIFVVALATIVGLHVFRLPLSVTGRENAGVALTILPVLPMAALIYLVWRHNFLQIGRQKNLIYAVSATFLALLYLSLVRRLSGWLEPVVPPEASASILLFVLVIFIEPLQRTLGRRIQESAHREMDRVQRLSAEIQQEAKQGDVAALVKFIERRTREEFELAATTVTLADRSGESPSPSPSPQLLPAADPDSANRFRIGAGEHIAGVLSVKPHGAFLSGETAAAIESLCERLPGAIDLCLLIEEKLRLERELAERERLAVLGQMAASISHNLKNPLGSIKTILQLQLENPEVPESIRGETRMVLQEVRRLSEKLNQLLQFSRPTVRGGAIDASCDAHEVAEEVVGLLRHEAEERGIALSLKATKENFAVEASAEALGEVISNLVVNALEAASRGGRVDVNLAIKGHDCVVSVEDDGPGIPSALHEKILQPFFTTKSKGTGLGLAIVARRVAEFRGVLKFVSPVPDATGTRFEVTLLSPVTR